MDTIQELKATEKQKLRAAERDYTEGRGDPKKVKEIEDAYYSLEENSARRMQYEQEDYQLEMVRMAEDHNRRILEMQTDYAIELEQLCKRAKRLGMVDAHGRYPWQKGYNERLQPVDVGKCY